MGYLPEAMRNYLLRLGWGHGDDEVFSTEQAIEWFDLDGIGRSAARFDFAKLDHLNGHYLREADDARLADLVARRLGGTDDAGHEILVKAMPGLKARAKNVKELSENAKFYLAERPLPLNDKAEKLLADGRDTLAKLIPALAAAPEWRDEALEALVREFAEREDLKLGAVAQPLRAALTGSNQSPGIFEVMTVLGREESLARIKDRI
jgi:glutamyl-tRNA synthetase